MVTGGCPKGGGVPGNVLPPTRGFPVPVTDKRLRRYHPSWAFDFLGSHSYSVASGHWSMASNTQVHCTPCINNLRCRFILFYAAADHGFDNIFLILNLHQQNINTRTSGSLFLSSLINSVFSRRLFKHLNIGISLIWTIDYR